VSSPQRPYLISPRIITPASRFFIRLPKLSLDETEKPRAVVAVLLILVSPR
jgi:hypothetical protein